MPLCSAAIFLSWAFGDPIGFWWILIAFPVDFIIALVRKPELVQKIISPPKKEEK